MARCRRNEDDSPDKVAVFVDNAKMYAQQAADIAQRLGLPAQMVRDIRNIEKRSFDVLYKYFSGYTGE